MDVFRVHQQLIGDYRAFTSGFVDVRDRRIAAHVAERLDSGTQWPDPWLSLNPNFAPGGTITELVQRKLLHPECERGLVDLVRVVRELGITSLAVPPLGCGQGGLDWQDVEPHIRVALSELPGVDIVLYPPGVTPPSATMRTSTKRPDMTTGRAALVLLLHRYTERALEVSLIEVQKLLYFLQVAGESLRLRFERGRYGPYADNLRHVLTLLEAHDLIGFGDGSVPVQAAEPIRVLPGSTDETARALVDHPETLARIDRVLALADGFESAYGMELLASVHWVVSHEDRTR